MLGACHSRPPCAALSRASRPPACMPSSTPASRHAGDDAALSGGDANGAEGYAHVRVGGWGRVGWGGVGALQKGNVPLIPLPIHSYLSNAMQAPVGAAGTASQDAPCYCCASIAHPPLPLKCNAASWPRRALALGTTKKVQGVSKTHFIPVHYPQMQAPAGAAGAAGQDAGRPRPHTGGGAAPAGGVRGRGAAKGGALVFRLPPNHPINCPPLPPAAGGAGCD